MAIDSSMQLKLNSLANKLLAQDTDKAVTKEEIQEFVKTNEAEFVSIDIDAASIEDELAQLLSDNMEKSEVGKSSDVASDDNGDKSIDELKAKINELKDKIQGYDSKISSLNTNLESLTSQLESETAKYEQLEQEAKAQNKKLEIVISTIDKTTEAMEDEVKHKQKTASMNAVAEYDPEKDGEWDEYIKNYMKDVDLDSSLKNKLSSLLSKSDFLQSNLSSLANSLSSQANKIQNLNILISKTQTDISSTTMLKDSANSEIKTLNTELSAKIAAQNTGSVNSTTEIGKTLMNDAIDSAKKPDDVMNLLSCEERKLIEDNNLDLTEKLCDGSPRYIFAKGALDNQYHVYDLGDKEGSSDCCSIYRSISRLYGSGGGFDICECGNGMITFDQNRSAMLQNFNKGNCDIYFLDDCSTVKECDNCCYGTDSPLSLDLNGDGVKTSSNIIDYDIDGDGKLDKINDSADAVLVFDKDGDGISGIDGSEAFGNNTDLDGDGKADGYKDGFEALKALAKKEGLINGNDDNKLDEKDLELLEEKYGLGIKKDGYLGETSSFKDAGITEINLADTNETEMIDNFDGNGNQLMRQKGATFKVNGETREYADIWHKKLSENDIELLNKGNNKAGGLNLFKDSSLSLNLAEINKNIKLAQRTKLDTKKAINNADSSINNFFISKPEKANEAEIEETEQEEINEKELEKKELEEEK